MATKVLILDAVSPLGLAIFDAFESTTYAVLAPVNTALDWENSQALAEFIRANDVSIVINSAGWNETPDAAKQRELVQAARALADAAKETGVSVVHLSSFRVFGAEKKSAYDEDDTPQPLGAAGKAFLEAENILLEAVPQCICLRVSWIFDVTGNAIFHRLLQDLTSPGPELVVTHLRRGAPLTAAEVGRVVRAMVHQIFCGAENWGVMHLASGDQGSSAEIVEVVAELLDRHGALKREWRVDSLENGHAQEQIEPESAVLTVRRCRDDFGYQVKSWRQGLSQLIRRWLEQRTINWE